MEFTDKLLPEEAPATKLFSLLKEFLPDGEAYQEVRYVACSLPAKSFALNGNSPQLDACVLCGAGEI